MVFYDTIENILHTRASRVVTLQFIAFIKLSDHVGLMHIIRYN